MAQHGGGRRSASTGYGKSSEPTCRPSDAALPGRRLHVRPPRPDHPPPPCLAARFCLRSRRARRLRVQPPQSCRRGPPAREAEESWGGGGGRAGARGDERGGGGGRWEEEKGDWERRTGARLAARVSPRRRFCLAAGVVKRRETQTTMFFPLICRPREK